MAGVSVVKRLVTGAKERTVSHAGDWSTALGLQRSHRKTKPNTEKRKEYLHTLNLAHASFLQNAHFFFWTFIPYLELFTRFSTVSRAFFKKYLNISPKRRCKCNARHTNLHRVLLRSLICFWVLLANARGRGPTVEAGAKSTYGHRASREYKGQTPLITD